jgi:hypothetical protein
LFEQELPAIDISPSTLPDTADAAVDGAPPVIVPEASTITPCASWAEPEIVPVTDAAATARLRTSDDALPGTRTVAASPDRSTATLSEAVVFEGLPLQEEMDVQSPFWQVALPVVDNVIASVYGPLSSVTARGVGAGPGELGDAGDPPQAPASSNAAARKAQRIRAFYRACARRARRVAELGSILSRTVEGTANEAYTPRQEGVMDVALAGTVLVALVGGWLLAGALRLMNRRASSNVLTRSAIAPPSPDAINMAHIRVEGVGGLGLIAAGVLIAIYLPEIGVSMLAGIGLGAAIAVGLIAYRSHVSAGPGGYNGQPPRLLLLDDHPVPVRPRTGHELPRARAAATA